MRLGFGMSALPKCSGLVHAVENTLKNGSNDILNFCRDTYEIFAEKELENQHSLLYTIFQNTTFLEFEAISKGLELTTDD